MRQDVWLGIATSDLKHANQTGHNIRKGDRVLIVVASNIPDRGWFISSTKTPRDSIYLKFNEINEYTKERHFFAKRDLNSQLRMNIRNFLYPMTFAEMANELELSLDRKDRLRAECVIETILENDWS